MEAALALVGAEVEERSLGDGRARSHSAVAESAGLAAYGPDGVDELDCSVCAEVTVEGAGVLEPFGHSDRGVVLVPVD
jgi:hypothetical protein